MKELVNNLGVQHRGVIVCWDNMSCRIILMTV
jgi:hypothetical protein